MLLPAIITASAGDRVVQATDAEVARDANDPFFPMIAAPCTYHLIRSAIDHLNGAPACH